MMLEEKLKQLQKRIKQYPLTSLIILLSVLLSLLIVVPYLQVEYRGINNATEEATLENQYRATFAQILGGIAIGIGLYYTWRRITIADKNLKFAQETFEANQKIAQDNLKVSQEGQITERFTRAIDQLGNKKMEIRLGGVYALERIANESEKDYWPIMRILAAYIREKSPLKKENTEHKDAEEQKKDETLSTDIQVILEVICNLKHSFNEKLDLRNSNMRKAQLSRAHLEWADLSGADIWGADLVEAHLESTQLYKAHLEDAILVRAHLENADMREAHLERAYLQGIDLKDATLIGAHLEDVHLENSVLVRAFLEETHLDRAYLEGAHLEYSHLKGAYLNDAHLKGIHLEIANLEGIHLKGADLEGVHFEGADLRGANLKGAKNLTIDQLSKVKTLYEAQLDEELLIPLKEKYPALFKKPDE
ncbi:hypothetical protein EO98_12850 [Methanosarcina sp. 2.H.T.1A.6]|uniref:pentapeptide repeat-containing protein n=1 Tax=unclassified Methanosarcina TaxID=2644672 RepID=UPI000621A68D|nr:MULTISPECIES: pentapeptide repeat-containing protein [unclassified Methanosarcina]KKG13800.1 hypothetical protein EO94_11505 [Methanosarcina sp. 2.H.T.1A.3]KKG18333.1 hypothetical protein EO97_15215 [Methanosarcina sp. 2.H.T.1A.15]KKG23144.1 hypothetical protein EO98_12850 [Methanosarcina sp. 2.H.T.1A.6]KKG26367.1 hypothetical protein EO96_05340 [Methanosarcina sp. 2.H.T.1A.8]